MVVQDSLSKQGNNRRNIIKLHGRSCPEAGHCLRSGHIVSAIVKAVSLLLFSAESFSCFSTSTYSGERPASCSEAWLWRSQAHSSRPIHLQLTVAAAGNARIPGMWRPRREGNPRDDWWPRVGLATCGTQKSYGFRSQRSGVNRPSVLQTVSTLSLPWRPCRRDSTVRTTAQITVSTPDDDVFAFS